MDLRHLKLEVGLKQTQNQKPACLSIMLSVVFFFYPSDTWEQLFGVSVVSATKCQNDSKHQKKPQVVNSPGSGPTTMTD